VTGILAVWNDCAQGADLDYENWYVREHLVERLSIPGFLTGRRYEALCGDRQFFTYYETEDPATLASPLYRQRLENPTAWTRRIMPSFIHASRTVCEVSARYGAIGGAHALTLRWSERPKVGTSPASLLSRIGAVEGVTQVQLWRSSDRQTPETAESQARGGADEYIGGALIVDCMRRRDVERAAELVASIDLREVLGVEAKPVVGTYALLCALNSVAGAAA
jgi:hypothetical protein